MPILNEMVLFSTTTGVLTTASAFRGTRFVDRLLERGVKIDVC